MDVHSEFAVHLNVRPCCVLVALVEQQKPSRLYEPRVTADSVSEIMENIAGLHRHLDQRRVLIVFAHHGSRPSGRATGQVSLLKQQDLPGSHAGQVHGYARPVNASANDDHIR